MCDLFCWEVEGTEADDSLCSNELRRKEKVSVRCGGVAVLVGLLLQLSQGGLNGHFGSSATSQAPPTLTPA